MTLEKQKPLFSKLWIISIILSVGLLIWAPHRFAGSFGLGCIAMILNLKWLFSILGDVFETENPKMNKILLQLGSKFAILGLCVFVFIRFLNLDLIGFGLGFFIVAISATYATSFSQKGL